MKIGIVGCGKMVTAVCEAIFKVKKTIKFHTFSKTFDSAKNLALLVDGFSADKLKSLEGADYLFLGCKPQQFGEVAQSIRESIDLKDTTIVSILAGTSIENISKELNTSKVIRLMPSMPIKEDFGISLFHFDESIESEDRKSFMSLFAHCSKNFIINTEKQFDQITTISSSGAAYVYFFTSVLADKLKEFGLSESDSKEMSIQLFLGSSKLMESSSESLQAMIDAVTSKKGVTIEAIDTFKRMGLNSIITKGVDNAFKRSEELGSLD